MSSVGIGKGAIVGGNVFTGVGVAVTVGVGVGVGIVVGGKTHPGKKSSAISIANNNTLQRNQYLLLPEEII